jgi:gamma-glutamylcyclotransferase (GGCT)/AIG2-like uncharacterized protein YtfP
MRSGIQVFAYGISVDEQIMADRCPCAVYSGRARLCDYRFQMNRYGVPTIQPSARGIVFGALWSLNSGELLELDYFEGTDQCFTARRQVDVIDESGAAVRAEAYVAKACGPGLPRHESLHAIIQAASRRAFPEPYLRELEGWRTEEQEEGR